MKTPIFDPVVLGWGGKDYTIPSFRVLGAIARVEEQITLSNLQIMLQTGNVPMARVASAYASVLQYAGCRVTGDEVYVGMTTGEQSAEICLAAVQGLLFMMLPRSVKEKIEAAVASEATAEGNQEAPSPGRKAQATPGKGRSKPSTKRSSARRKQAAA